MIVIPTHHVQVVRRLIEQENVRVLHGKDGEHNSGYQSFAGQHAHVTHRLRRPSDSWLIGLVW